MARAPREPLGRFLHGRVEVAVGNITQEAVDAIVNAANSSLLGGGGVDGAIHAAGGPEILAACRELRRTQHPDGLPTGEAVLTVAGALTARYVIHTVGPIYGREHGREAELLASCYRRSLELARAHDLRSIAFPAISTGAFGYPEAEAASVVSRTLEEMLPGAPGIEQVRLVLFSEGAARQFLASQSFTPD